MEYINQIVCMDVFRYLRHLPAKSVHCVICSPPYYGLREYGLFEWIGGDAACKHLTGRAARGGVSDKQASMTGSFQSESSDTCPSCGAKKVRLTAVRWPEVSYSPMAGLPRITVPEWEGELGQEPTPEMFVGHLVEIYREVWEVLRDDGTCWINLADTMTGGGRGDTPPLNVAAWKQGTNVGSRVDQRTNVKSLSAKSQLGIPWRVAFALQADGWILRRDNIWWKPNALPYSGSDNTTPAHEYFFMLTKKKNYYSDFEAVKTLVKTESAARALRGVSDNHKNTNGAPGQTPHSFLKPRPNVNGVLHKNLLDKGQTKHSMHIKRANGEGEPAAAKANLRSVFRIPTKGFPGSHFAVYPEDLVAIPIKAGSPEKCCAKCDKPYERIVERMPVYTDKYPNGAGGSITRNMAKENPREKMPDGKPPAYATEMVGWKKMCKCATDETVGGIVLDIFSGSGTTALEARRLGRRYAGVEINPKYHAMSLERMRLPFEAHHVEPLKPAEMPAVQGAEGMVTKPLWEVV